MEPHGLTAVVPSTALRRAQPSDPSAKAYGQRAEAYPPSLSTPPKQPLRLRRPGAKATEDTLIHPCPHGRGFLRFAEEGKLIFGGFYLEGMRLLRFPFRNFANACRIVQSEAGDATRN